MKLPCRWGKNFKGESWLPESPDSFEIGQSGNGCFCRWHVLPDDIFLVKWHHFPALLVSYCVCCHIFSIEKWKKLALNWPYKKKEKKKEEFSMVFAPLDPHRSAGPWVDRLMGTGPRLPMQIPATGVMDIDCWWVLVHGCLCRSLVVVQVW